MERGDFNLRQCLEMWGQDYPSRSPAIIPDMMTAVVWGAQILNGLRTLHRHEIIHRDLKPENIVIFLSACRAPTLKLCDLGLSTTPSAALAVAAVGTLWYRAPEVVQRHRYGPPADIWAAGVILAELCVGECIFSRAVAEADLLPLVGQVLPDERAFCGPSAQEASKAPGEDVNAESSPTLLDQLAPRTPEAVATFVVSLLRVEPGRRPSSAVAADQCKLLESLLPLGRSSDVYLVDSSSATTVPGTPALPAASPTPAGGKQATAVEGAAVVATIPPRMRLRKKTRPTGTATQPVGKPQTKLRKRLNRVRTRKNHQPPAAGTVLCAPQAGDEGQHGVAAPQPGGGGAAPTPSPEGKRCECAHNCGSAQHFNRRKKDCTHPATWSVVVRINMGAEHTKHLCEHCCCSQCRAAPSRQKGLCFRCVRHGDGAGSLKGIQIRNSISPFIRNSWIAITVGPRQR